MSDIVLKIPIKVRLAEILDELRTLREGEMHMALTMCSN